MKNMRKLIPAIAMLLVSAVMMSTASFAWFSIANTATATGMQVKATASGGIAIGAYTGTAGGTATAPVPTAFGSNVVLSSAWMNAAGTSLKPASLNPTTEEWWYATSDKVDTNTAVTGTYEEVAAGGANHYLHQKVQIKALGSASQKLYVDNITITAAASSTTTAALNQALRVALNVNGKWFIFAPGRSATDFTPLCANGTATPTELTKYVYNASHTTTNTDNSIAFGSAITSGTATYNGDMIIYDSLTTAAIDVDIYVYYEGEDPACITAYAVDLVNTQVDIGFSAS